MREAVEALSLIRVLDVRQGDGTYVTSLEPALLLDAIGFVMDFHQDDTVLRILEVRGVLEPAATEPAAVRMTDAQIAELGASPSVAALVANDLRFHHHIAAGSGNDVLCSLIDSLSAPTTRARIWRGLTQEGAVRRTREQHEAICEAIEARRPEVARRGDVHVAGVEMWIRDALGAPGRPSPSRPEGVE
ncbi:FCD domain-containing protein [Micromonospora sp. WMMC241]|uniref:FadR/GntR family transcriptional regulator n=1 Tax=Micromonospora sp. WMMC241 TaxID=3015159 RepID=UPI0022B60E49|nr:FCD domain-containing protein [Micromonospora sp. WMMC241]MCZ7438251.1 FCD domain-containing protein [Micromonospora sp. WMMC241]